MFSTSLMQWKMFLAVAAGLIVLLFLSRETIKPLTGYHFDRLVHADDTAANQTLGFQKVMVLSRHPSWRTRGLRAAANITQIELTIPAQPRNPKELVEAFQRIGPDDLIHPLTGSATAWLAHIDMIKFVIASGFETALIMENDVDWDISCERTDEAVVQRGSQLHQYRSQ